MRCSGIFQLIPPFPSPPPTAPNLTQMKRKAVIFHFCWRRWLLVVMAADPFWTPFLDPIIGPHFKPHFWTPFWTPFWKMLKNGHRRAPRADPRPRLSKVSKQNCLGANYHFGEPPKIRHSILDPIFGFHFWTPLLDPQFWIPFWTPFFVINQLIN